MSISVRIFEFRMGIGIEKSDKFHFIDMFLRDGHFETVCLLSKLHEAKNHINIKVDMDELDLTSAEAKAT